MPVIYFRTDGNENIATGHIMRCLSIARACTAMHVESRFLVSDEQSMAILKERFAFTDEFPIRCLHSNYKNMEAELPALQSVLKDASLLFLDSYFITESYLAALHKVCRIAYLDDMLAFDYPVDLIINYDITEEPSCYHKAAHKLLGASYTPLREQFQNVSYTVRPEVQNILISTGGTDTENLAGKLLKTIFAQKSDTDVTNSVVSLTEYHYHIITSRLNPHLEELEQLASFHPTIHIHENVQNMAALMCQCDLAVSAGGTTLYELCAVGVPTISFSMADNQLSAVETFRTKEIITYAGDVRSSSKNIIDTISTFLIENISYEKRKKSSHTMRAFLDGRGAERIAAALIHLFFFQHQ